MTLIRNLYDVHPFDINGPRIGEAEAHNMLRLTRIGPPKNIRFIIQALNVAIGVEIEIENAAGNRRLNELIGQHWITKEDGSLRNQGIELITPLGLRAYQVFPRLHKLLPGLEAEGCRWSDRTSIHVHVNVQNLTLEQLNSYVILYLIFEESLFQFAAPTRRSNIFCVPLIDQNLGDAVSFDRVIRNAQKYSAMNLQCVRTFGSVEFRHLAGTFDAYKTCLWILLLTLLKRAATHIPLTEIEERIMRLKHESDYHNFMSWIFGETIPMALPWQGQDLDRAATETKTLFFNKRSMG